MSLTKDPLNDKKLKEKARRAARMLDECGSEEEFRLKCEALNFDADALFKPWTEWMTHAAGYVKLGIFPSFTLSQWYTYTRIKGANKPDPWLRGMCDRLN